MIRIVVRNAQRVRYALVRAQRDARAAQESAAREGAGLIAARARTDARAPRKTGRMAGSVRVGPGGSVLLDGEQYFSPVYWGSKRNRPRPWVHGVAFENEDAVVSIFSNRLDVVFVRAGIVTGGAPIGRSRVRGAPSSGRAYNP